MLPMKPRSIRGNWATLRRPYSWILEREASRVRIRGRELVPEFFQLGRARLD